MNMLTVSSAEAQSNRPNLMKRGEFIILLLACYSSEIVRVPLVQLIHQHLQHELMGTKGLEIKTASKLEKPAFRGSCLPQQVWEPKITCSTLLRKRLLAHNMKVSPVLVLVSLSWNWAQRPRAGLDRWLWHWRWRNQRPGLGADTVGATSGTGRRRGGTEACPRLSLKLSVQHRGWRAGLATRTCPSRSDDFQQKAACRLVSRHLSDSACCKLCLLNKAIDVSSSWWSTEAKEARDCNLCLHLFFLLLFNILYLII